MVDALDDVLQRPVSDQIFCRLLAVCRGHRLAHAPGGVVDDSQSQTFCRLSWRGEHRPQKGTPQKAKDQLLSPSPPPTWPAPAKGSSGRSPPHLPKNPGQILRPVLESGVAAMVLRVLAAKVH